MAHHTLDPGIIHKFRVSLTRMKRLCFVLKPWLWPPLHRSPCVANCLLLFSFPLGHSHCSSSPRCLWWGHLQFCYTKRSQDNFQKAFWEGIYCQRCKQAPGARDSPSWGPWEIQPNSEWQWMCTSASKCLLSSSLCITFCVQYRHVFDDSPSDFSLFFLINFPKLFKHSFPRPTFWLLWSHSMGKKSPFWLATDFFLGRDSVYKNLHC